MGNIVVNKGRFFSRHVVAHRHPKTSTSSSISCEVHHHYHCEGFIATFPANHGKTLALPVASRLAVETCPMRSAAGFRFDWLNMTTFHTAVSIAELRCLCAAGKLPETGSDGKKLHLSSAVNISCHRWHYVLRGILESVRRRCLGTVS